jgi:hypothetical protein
MRLILTLRRNPWRLSSLILVALALLPPVGRPQSQDSSESVVEAARRARENKKKAAARPAPVITDDVLKPATPSTVVSATAELPRMPGAPPSDAQINSPNTNAPAAKASGEPSPAAESTPAAGDKTEQAKLKQQLEAAQKELDLLQRELALERDNYYKNPDYIHDTAGKAKLDGLNQRIADKQQEVQGLKARLATTPSSQSTPPSPQS